MKKFISVVTRIVKNADDMDLVSIATEMAFRLNLAIFPFIIFLMSLVGYFNVDATRFLIDMGDAFPEAIMTFLKVFIDEVIDTKNASVLSASLILTIFSASAGLRSVMRGINKAYGQKETRNYILVFLTSIFLVIALAFAIVVSMLFLVYGDILYNFLLNYFKFNGFVESMFGFAGNLVTLALLVFSIVCIYKFGSCKKQRIIDVLPGSIITVIVWLLTSKVFNVYINNFSRYSKVYGSIASVIILMLWLNVISIVILLGALINAKLEKHAK